MHGSQKKKNIYIMHIMWLNVAVMNNKYNADIFQWKRKK